jgi:hypothetical protein
MGLAKLSILNIEQGISNFEFRMCAPIIIRHSLIDVRYLAQYCNQLMSYLSTNFSTRHKHSTLNFAVIFKWVKRQWGSSDVQSEDSCLLALAGCAAIVAQCLL